MNSQLKWLALLLLFATPTAQAQQNDIFKSQFTIGVGGGPVFSSLDFDPTIPQTSNQAFSACVAVKFISEKHLGLLAELNYTQRGWIEDFSELPKNPDHSYSRTLNYIELPLMTHIYFGNKVKFILNLGPQISYMFSDKSSMNDALSSYLDEQREKDPDAPIGLQYENLDSKFDYGLLGGAGIAFDTAAGSFNLEGRYYFGLGDSFDNSRSRAGNFSRSSHSYFSGKLTYYLFSF